MKYRSIPGDTQANVYLAVNKGNIRSERCPKAPHDGSDVGRPFPRYCASCGVTIGLDVNNGHSLTCESGRCEMCVT